MTLFTKPIDQIAFDDVQSFVDNWPEGIRVEYKEDFPSNLPKSISSFANTLGGIMVLGVREDKAACARSIVGADKVAGIKERIIDSSVNGIYPAIIPDVSVIDLPSTTNKVVVVIKITESPLAPHAIQNSTRFYVRYENISGIVDLADTARIEHLIKRRENSEEFRERLFQKMFDHCKADFARHEHPLIQIQGSPLYPYRPIVSKDQLYQFANAYQKARYQPFHVTAEGPIRVSDGVLGQLLSQDDLEYNRMNDHGCFLSGSTMDKHEMTLQNRAVIFIHLRGVLVPLWTRLDFISRFYEGCSPPYRGNILIKVNLINVLNREMLFVEFARPPREYIAHEKEIGISRQLLTDELKTNLHGIVKSMAKEIFWAFQADYPNLGNVIDRCLEANGFIGVSKS